MRPDNSKFLLRLLFIALVLLCIVLGTGCSDLEVKWGSAKADEESLVKVHPKVITDLAANSKCAAYSWKNRGRAPKAYMRGMALVYARSVCNIKRSDVALVAQAKTGNDVSDALSWHNSNFRKLGMRNDTAGVDTLRHAYTLLIGLGMRESTGRYCCGRDLSAGFTESSTAEAGLFQASWGAARVHKELPRLFARYQSLEKDECFLSVFSEGVKCPASDFKSWGTGEGATWQRLTKMCPAFAVEYAAVLVRVHGGTRGEFGPLRRKEAEIRPECDAMLKGVHAIVEKNPSICDAL